MLALATANTFEYIQILNTCPCDCLIKGWHMVGVGQIWVKYIWPRHFVQPAGQPHVHRKYIFWVC